MFAHWVLLVLLLPCSALLSGAETALFGLSRLELREFEGHGSRLQRQARRLMAHPRRVLMTVLIANTAVNVLFFAISFVVLGQVAEHSPLAATVGSVGAVLVVIVFGEILPKAIARPHAARFAPLAGVLVRALQTVLGPVLTVLHVALVEPLTRLFQLHPMQPHDVSVEELRALVTISAHQGVIDPAENHILQQIVALPETNVRSIMCPRVDVLAAGLREPPEQVRRRIREAMVTRLLVYGRDLDDVRGLVHARDLFLKPDVPLASLVRPTSFVPEQANLLQLIEHFRQTQSQLAVVVDEYGGMAGLVTLDDVLEEIVGEVGGRQPADPATEVIDENTYRLAGDLSVRDWAERFGLPGVPTNARFQTVAGLVLSHLGRWPREGDSVRIQNLRLAVERLDGRRIDRILLTREPRETPASPRTPGSSGPQP